MFKKILRALRTLSYLKIDQFLYLILRRTLPAKISTIKQQPIKRGEFNLAPPLPMNTMLQSEYSFYFVGIEEIFNDLSIDWESSDKSDLWRFNLHYFDFLRDENRSVESKAQIIDDWINNCPQVPSIAWDPFTCSLRVVNWIYFFVSIDFLGIKDEWLKSLYLQVIYIAENDERELLANHYFENIKAIMFAGVFFEGKQADKWLKKSQKLLREQIQEQFLEDGGHYEKSPQYHCLMIENCLDLYNLFANNRAICDLSLQALLKSQIESSLHWLADIHYHNGDFPLFNDSANNVAPTYAELCQYASRLFLYEPEASIVSGGKLINLDASGYYGLEVNVDKFIIDCGDISPSYQPGHTHCDFLSYELVLDDQLVVVDSGVYEYAEGEMRQYVRSTKAHNTVSVDGDEQSEIWAAFRVARRAIKTHAEIMLSSEGAIFRGGYQGFYNVKGKAKHSREVEILLDSTQKSISKIQIQDKIECRGEHSIESFIHLNPAISCDDQGDGRIALMMHGELVANVIIEKNCDYTISGSYYCPEFGKKLDNCVIFLKKQGIDTISTGYEILKC